MAYENAKFLEGTHVADADLSAKKFFAVKLTATGIALAGVGEAGVGILSNSPKLGEICQIAYQGPMKAIAGAAFNRGIKLASDANGKLITAVATNFIVATALETAAGDGSVVSVLWENNGIAA